MFSKQDIPGIANAPVLRIVGMPQPCKRADPADVDCHGF